jgi:DNA-binding transcriptional MocR family regulator
MPVNSFENYPMTWKPVIDKTVKSLYGDLAEQLELDIVNGRLLPGTKLPPQRELADYLDINVSTITKAFRLCEQKGLLSAKVGSGTFVSFDALSNAYLLSDSKPAGLVEMGATIPEPASYEPLMHQLRAMVQEADYGKWFSYSRTNDERWQKDAAVKLMRKSGYAANADNILLSNGGQNAITAILAGLCSRGDRIGADPHTYPGLKTAAGMLGIQLVAVRNKDGEMDGEALTSACRNENLKGIYLVPDHHNPTTHRMSLLGRKNLAHIAKKNDIFIIEDATYPLMCTEVLPAVASYAPDQTIYITSVSKSMGPGLRIAYVSVPKQHRTLIANALYNMNISVSPLLAELSARMIVSNGIDVVIESHRRKTIERNRLVDQYLNGYECCGEESCIFRWLRLPPGVTGAEFEALALQGGVQIYAAERFAVGNSIPEKAVRISVSAPETIEELEKGLAILQGILASIK